MKIDRLIFMLDGNPNYSGFWNISSRWHAENFNVKPTLIFLGEEEDAKKLNLSEKHGEIVYLENHKEFIKDPELNWSVTWSNFYGASMFPEDVSMMLGLDQFLLNYEFWKYIEPFDEDSLVIGLSEAYDGADFGKILNGETGKLLGGFRKLCDKCLYPSAFVAGKGKVIKDLLDIEDDWYDEIKRAYDASPQYVNPENKSGYRAEIDDGTIMCGIPESLWGLDEAFFSDLICNLPENKRKKVILGDFWTSNGGMEKKRVERQPHGDRQEYVIREKAAWGNRSILSLARDGSLREIHCHRPWIQPKVKDVHAAVNNHTSPSFCPPHELIATVILSEAKAYLEENKHEIL